MKKRILGGVLLTAAACAGIAGGILFYPALPNTAEAFCALTAAHVETQSPSPVSQQLDAPQTLSAEQALQACGADADFDPNADTVVYLSGSVTAGGQVYRCGAYVALSREDRTARVLCTDSAFEPSDPSWTNTVLSSQAAVLADGSVQLVGSGVFAQAQQVSLLVRDGWSLQTVRTDWYTRQPYSYHMVSPV